jgi:tetratricopeptide (TPR) repeat protein
VFRPLAQARNRADEIVYTDLVAGPARNPLLNFPRTAMRCGLMMRALASGIFLIELFQAAPLAGADDSADNLACDRTGAVAACTRALAHIEAEIRKHPNHAELYRERGVIHRRLHHLDQAQADFNRIFAIQPTDAESYISRSTALLHMRYRDDALKDAEQAIKLAPRNPDGYILRGILHLGGKTDDQAIADFTRAIALQPDRALTYVSRSSAHINRGEYALANEDCLRAIALMPNHTATMGTDPETAQVVRCKPAQ